MPTHRPLHVDAATDDGGPQLRLCDGAFHVGCDMEGTFPGACSGWQRSSIRSDATIGVHTQLDWMTMLERTPTAQAFQRKAIVLSIGLFIATFLLTRQTQIDALNGLGAPWALLMTIAFLRVERSWQLLIPMVLYASTSALASSVTGHDAGSVLRFYVITIGTLLAFCVRPIRISAKVALLPLVLQAVIVSGISLYLGYARDDELAAAVRGYVLSTEWGDIYSFDGIYYRVQLIGNALLPFLFLVSLWKYREARFFRWVTFISFVGVIAAGNLTYSIVIAIGMLVHARAWLRRHVIKWFALVAAVCIGTVAFWGDIDEIVTRKFDGSDSSMGIRFDQVDVAVRAWEESPALLMVGSGLGAPYPNGKERDYSQYQYIELQALYLLIQLGLVGMLIYVATLVLAANSFLNTDGRTIFWLYVLSGATNPTIFDTNQIVATIILICLFPRNPKSVGTRVRSSSQPQCSQLTSMS